MDAVAALDDGLRLGSLFVALQADEACGDAGGLWEVAAADGGPKLRTLALVDGLGHGGPAAAAAQQALRLVGEQPAAPLPALMNRLDTGLRDGRGAAIGLAQLRGSCLRYAGVGNTRAVRWRGAEWLRLSSQYGVVGGGLNAPVEVVEIDLQPGDWWLMFSDGLDEMLKLPAPLPEWTREPDSLCRHLFSHWRQGRDDVGVLALHRD